MNVTQRRKHDINTKIFVAVFLVGTLLRLFALSSHDFWFDEAFTYEISKLPLQKLFLATLSDNNPPFYYLIIHFLLKINQSEIWLRLPSLLASLATIYLIYVLGKNYINTKTAKAAAALFALSPLAVYLSAEVRLHSLAVLILTAMVLSFFNMTKNFNLKNIVIFLIISTLGAYTQYYIILLEIAFILLAISARKPQRAKTTLIVILPLILLVPWILLSKNVIQNACWCPSTILSLPSVLVSPSVSGVGIVTLRYFTHLPIPVLLLFFISATASSLFFLKGLFKNKVLALTYLIPLILLSIAGFFIPVFSPKAFAVFIPVFFLIMALGLEKSYRWTVPLLILIFGVTTMIQITNPFFGGEQIKAAYLATKSNLEAPVYHTSLVTFYSFDFYSQKSSAYSKDLQKNILLTKNPLSSALVSYIGGETLKVKNIYDTAWLVDIDKWTDKQNRFDALSQVFTNYKNGEHNESGGISVYKLRKK